MNKARYDWHVTHMCKDGSFGFASVYPKTKKPNSIRCPYCSKWAERWKTESVKIYFGEVKDPEETPKMTSWYFPKAEWLMRREWGKWIVLQYVKLRTYLGGSHE